MPLSSKMEGEFEIGFYDPWGNFYPSYRQKIYRGKTSTTPAQPTGRSEMEESKPTIQAIISQKLREALPSLIDLHIEDKSGGCGQSFLVIVVAD